MRVLEAGRGRLVEQRHHLEAGSGEGVQGEEALRARGVGRDADRGLDPLAGAHVDVRAVLQVAAQLREETREKLAEPVRASSQVDLRSAARHR